MISLQDKIHKFEKMIYNKQLDDFILIDDQFIGGGITMQSLIKENAFIVQQIKKMKNVFVNYCKLNQTVYQKITQHQLALHAESNKLNSLSNTAQRKMNDSVRQIKQMYEQMQYQSLRTKSLVEEAIKPIEQAIKQKVDESSFSKQMKKILQQLDQDDQLPQASLQGNVQGNASLVQEGTLRRKKGKPVYNEEYLLQKQKNTRLFVQISQRIQLIHDKNTQSQSLLHRNTSNINNIAQNMNIHQSQIFKLEKDSKEIRSFLNLTQRRLLQQIINRTSDKVWQRNLSTFETAFISPRFQNLSKQVSAGRKQTSTGFAQLQPRLYNLSKNIETLQGQCQQNKGQIELNYQGLEQTRSELIKQIEAVQQKLNILQIQKRVKIQKVNEKIDLQIQSRKKQVQALKQTIKGLTKQIQQKVTAGVKKNMQIKIHQFDKVICKLSNKQKIMHEQILNSKGQIHNIKQVLSKKANFSDMLIHFEKKADKGDFKQLKDILQTTPSYMKTTIFDSPEKTRRTLSANSRRKTNHSKNVMNPSNIINFDKQSLQSDNQNNSRLFLMGIQNDLNFQADKRRMSFTDTTRRKKMRFTNRIINLTSNV